jgi:hypothetical protein
MTEKLNNLGLCHPRGIVEGDDQGAQTWTEFSLVTGRSSSLKNGYLTLLGLDFTLNNLFC